MVQTYTEVKRTGTVSAVLWETGKRQGSTVAVLVGVYSSANTVVGQPLFLAAAANAVPAGIWKYAVWRRAGFIL